MEHVRRPSDSFGKYSTGKYKHIFADNQTLFTKMWRFCNFVTKLLHPSAFPPAVTDAALAAEATAAQKPPERLAAA